MICSVFDVATSSYYDYRKRSQVIDVKRLQLQARLKELFRLSRGSAGSRTLVIMMRDLGYMIGRFKVRSLMRDAMLVSKQSKAHVYKQTEVERLDIPNHLDRAFDVDAPNRVWCGDITYIWADGCWHYLAVVIDLYSRRVIGWGLSANADAELTGSSEPWIWLIYSVGNRVGFYSILTRGANMPVGCFDSGYGVTRHSKV